MTDNEHLIENILAYVQSVGWANVPEQSDKKSFYDLYERYSKNGETQVTPDTFKWLLEMATYVVYQATDWGVTFEQEEK